MENRNALHTHSWSDGSAPHVFKQDGRTIFHHRCVRCGRDFAQGLNGAGWQAIYVGVFKVELLAETVTSRWLTEECPERPVPDDDVSRAMRHG